MPLDLPVRSLREDLTRAVASHRRLIASAPTGSGKSTQLPQMLLDGGLVPEGQIVVLQPRRIAARMLAARVAAERGSRLGDDIGYQVRLEKRTGPETRIRYVTEGILLRELLRDPACPHVGAILLDEFHERHLYGDISLGLALDLLESVRPDLLLVVMSATLDQASIRDALEPCAVLESAGRTFPVEQHYLQKRINPDRTAIWEAAADAAASLVRDGAGGDILIFMPGAYEIRRTIEALGHQRETRSLLTLALHGELPAAEQDAAVSPHGQRKIIVATNVAETSLTIEGIRIVIDGGLARIPDFDPHRGINTLFIRKISRASADQRAGRAGRTAPGICLRLWTEKEHRERPLRETPEVQRLDLSESTLLLKACGVADIRAFRWLDPPDEPSLQRAETLLDDLGATREGTLTPLGRQMVAFPMHPRYARLLLAAEIFGCVKEAALIVALAQGRSILVNQPGKEARDRLASLTVAQDESDFFTLMQAFAHAEQSRFRTAPCRDLGIHAQAARQAGSLAPTFLAIAEREGLHIASEAASRQAIRRCLLVAFIDQLAKRRDGGTLRCDVVHGRRGELTKQSVVREADLFVAAEISEIQASRGQVSVRLSLCTAVEETWLREQFSDDFREERITDFDNTGKRLVSFHVVRFRDLVLRRKPMGDPDAEGAARRLAGAVLAGDFRIKAWDQAVEQWLVRVNRLAKWCPEFEIAPVTDDDRRILLEQICLGAFSAREIRDRPVWPVIRQWLSREQAAALEAYAPERLKLPSGRGARITYRDDGPPEIAARIQDLYGVKDRLTIAQGRVPLRIQVLAPNHRPVQVTDSLAGFWTNTYPAVKKELQKKYPKHEWR